METIRKKRKMETGRETEIVDLPVALLSGIISLTSPRDACRSALMSRLFRLASDSDYVWEKLLPSDYKELISQSATIPETIRSGPKKDLYFYLCNNPIRIDNGNMSFSIDRKSGKKCFMVGARGLLIALGNTPQHWQWISRSDFSGPESRFLQVAVLIKGWWLQIDARVETGILSPHTTYEAYFVFKIAEDNHSFQKIPVQLRVNFEGRVGVVLHVFLDLEGNDRKDGWTEIKMGEFFNEDGEDGSVFCSLTQADDDSSKSGLVVEGIELRPKHV